MTDPRDGDQSARDGTDKPFSFTDRRRIDPQTGARRDTGDTPASGGVPGGAGPFAGSADPGDPANAGQKISVDASGPELEAAQQESADRLADLQRVTAEYANYRKRVDRDREQVVVSAKASVLTEMLVVLDDLDRAEAHGDLTGAFKAVADKLTGILQKLGLEQIGATDDVFDPAVHEAVQFATSADVTEQVISDVLRHGYAVSGRLVRPAVVVVTGPEDESAGSAAADNSDDAGATDRPQEESDQGDIGSDTAGSGDADSAPDQ